MKELQGVTPDTPVFTELEALSMYVDELFCVFTVVLLIKDSPSDARFDIPFGWFFHH